MHQKTATTSKKSTARLQAPRQRWKATLLASAAALTLLGVAVDAQAMALGAITVRSALGEPLRAEIAVPEISSQEAADFRAALASRDAFRASGVEYSQALAGARLTLHRRSNGEAYLLLVGNQPIREPFLGVVIEANWANGGRIVRDYTMLIDPPSQPAPPVLANRPQVTQPPTPPVQIAPDNTPAPPPIEARPSVRRPAPAAGGDGAQVTVQRGDTATGIVTAHPVEGASLDQMLIALLRANPKAFINGNVNRMRSGAVLNMPTTEQAKALPRQAARHAVVVQARDFNAFRHGLASNAPGMDNKVPAGRSGTGSVKPLVPNNNPVPPDQLQVAPVGGKDSNAAEIARQRQIEAQKNREKELAENNKKLIDLLPSPSGGAGAAVPPASTPSSVIPPVQMGVPVTPPPPPAPPPSVPASPASGPGSVLPVTPAGSTASGPSEPASPPASALIVSKPAPVPSAPVLPPPVVKKTPPPSWTDALADNLMAPVVGGLVVLLLLGLGFARWRRGKETGDETSLDSSFIESHLRPDSFFGASGGQHVNTRESGTAGGPGQHSSMAYSPSQLDAAGDVDPVAEADVYLAYGRDLQAEEILKEALRIHPDRIAIYRKLAEIYAKNRDARALESVAVTAYEMTHGEGPDWLAITALGSELDPVNPLYKPGGSPVARPAPLPVHGGRFGADTEPQSTQVLAPNTQVLEKRPSGGGTDATAAPAHSDFAASGPVDLDLDLEDAAPVPSRQPAAPSRPPEPAQGLAFAPPTEPAPVARPPQASAAPARASRSGMMDFDMKALSINPDSRGAPSVQPDDDDPIGTKLALAQEFHAIGDTEGARSLLKEVIAEATGALKARAERFLSELN